MNSTQPSRNAPRPVAEPGGPALYEAEVERMLAPAGLGRAEARLYAVLLHRPGGTADELAAQLHLPVRRVCAILGELASNGLVSRIAGRPERYLPAPPDAAIEPLLTRRQEDLQRARELAAELAEYVRSAALPPGGGPETIELLAGRDAVAQRVQQLEQAARTETLSFDRPPYYTDSSENPGEISGLARGVIYRGVYAHDALDLPGRMDHIRAMTRRGEQARVFSPLPLKLFIFDRHTAFLPVRPLDPELAAGAVLVRTSALLDALHMFFELVWARATPIALGPSQPIGAGRQADGPVDDLIPLLAAGLTDEAAARQLSISRRTLQRRIQALMETLDARSRFQAGYQVGLNLNPPRKFE
jgi:predicted transcriptional regulator